MAEDHRLGRARGPAGVVDHVGVLSAARRQLGELEGLGGVELRRLKTTDAKRDEKGGGPTGFDFEAAAHGKHARKLRKKRRVIVASGGAGSSARRGCVVEHGEAPNGLVHERALVSRRGGPHRAALARDDDGAHPVPTALGGRGGGEEVQGLGEERAERLLADLGAGRAEGRK